MFVMVCSRDEYTEEKRTENNLILRSGISEAETTNNKRLRSTFCIEAIQTRSIALPLRQLFVMYVVRPNFEKKQEYDAWISGVCRPKFTKPGTRV